MTDFTYLGSELELFAQARNWKAYWSAQIAPFVAGDVLEVGAGVGSNTRLLDHRAGQWVCLEPDAKLAAQLSRNIQQQTGRACETICGTLRTLPRERLFDTIAYVDVLEHIEDDAEELKLAAAHLRPNGRLIVVSPSHQSLFTPFDAAIGHFRRYDRSTLRKISPTGLRLERMRYLDCMGLTASAANLVLRQSMPTSAQLRFWDHWIIPVSRVLDPLFLYTIGKSILAIWSKSDQRFTPSS